MRVVSIRKLICGDCRDAVKELAPGSVDLIYLDPPFNSKKQYNLPFKKLGRDIKIARRETTEMPHMPAMV